jgi:hypothetical protein
MLLAGRYGGQKHMIGAPIFPIYKKVLTAALGMALLVHAGMSIALAAAGKPFGESLAMFISLSWSGIEGLRVGHFLG